MITKKKIDIQDEQSTIISMIISDKFLREFINFANPLLFKTNAAKKISEWCITYFHKYEKAPGKLIQEIFESNKNSNTISEEDTELIDIYLQNLTDKYEQQNYNIEYYLDKAEAYLKLRNLENFSGRIGHCIINNEVQQAEALIAGFTRVERHLSTGIDTLNCSDAEIIERFNSEEDGDVLFSMPGELGKVMGSFCRGDFFAIAAPPKRGKSWWMQQIGIYALHAGLKVLFISMEMTEKKLMRRFFQSILAETKQKYDYPIEVPFFDGDSIGIKEVLKNGITASKAIRKRKSIKKMFSSAGFKIICYPQYSANVDTVYTLLENLEHYEDFVPDVIIDDYADIHAPESGQNNDYRHKLDATWKRFRGMAQERKCLVVTGTQTTRSSLKNDAEQDTIAEDIRKLAHVTGMISLNQNAEERKQHIMRVKVLAARDDYFNQDQDVEVLYQYAIGKPILDSRIKR